MRRRLLLAAAAVAVAAGVAVILLGRSVLAERVGLDRARTDLAAPLAAPPAVSGGGVASLVLDTRGERAALAAAADFERAQTPGAAAGGARALRELVQLADSGAADRRSWASNLLAVLDLDEAQIAGPSGAHFVAAALAALERAVAADPANEYAKRDLELLLTLQHPHSGKRKQAPTRQPPHSRHTRGHRRFAKAEAGFSAPGTGW